MPDYEDSLGDQNTFDGGGQEKDNVSQSLGDEVTFGGDADSIDEALDDDMEIVDLAARYTTDGVLGKGGMGEVLLATDTRLNRKVAIKRILGSGARSKTAVSRFLTEAQSIAALNHPNIVQIYDYGRDKDGPFLIMEYVDGCSLLEKCHQGPIEQVEAIDLTTQLCDALAKAHAAKIIHRDIKPANVLISSDGVSKLTDFGLAKEDAADSGRTMAGTLLGTLDFMPPEQRKDSSLADARSDLWSLAATFYQMLTGKSPKVIRLNALPVSLQDVLGKAFEEDKEARFQSALEFRNALVDCREDGERNVSDLGEGQCLTCGTKNEASRKFCRKCASPLEVACVACSGVMPVWENICGICGANQEKFLHERREEMAAAKTAAENCVVNQEYAEAIRLAKDLALEQDVRLTHLRTWSAQFIAEVDSERERELTRVRDLILESVAHEDAYDYPAAIRTLAQIPEVFHSETVPGQKKSVATILDRLQGKQSECDKLEVRIREQVKSRQLNDLLALVEQLLELVPHRADLVNLREQVVSRNSKLQKVRTKLYRSAQEAFESQSYKKCLSILQKVDPYFEDEDVRKLRVEAECKLERLGELREYISSRVSIKDLDGLLDYVEECLALRNNDAGMQTLRGQLLARLEKHAERVESVMATARALRSQVRFDDAVEVLERIPEALRSERVEHLASECGSLAYQRNLALLALRSSRKTEDYSKGIQESAAYELMLTSAADVQDKEFMELLEQTKVGRQIQRAAENKVKAKRATRIKITLLFSLFAAGGGAFLYNDWQHGLQRSQEVTSALNEKRWDDALTIDPSNVNALVGRANNELELAEPRHEWILEEVKRIEVLAPSHPAIKHIRGVVFSLKAVRASDAGEIDIAERWRRDSQRFKTDEAHLTLLDKSLALAYAKRAAVEVASGKVADAGKSVRRAKTLDSQVKLDKAVTVAMSELRANELMEVYDADLSHLNRTSVLAALRELEVLSPESKVLGQISTRIRSMDLAAAELVVNERVEEYQEESTPSRRVAAISALEKLGSLGAEPSVITKYRDEIEQITVALLDKEAQQVVRNYIEEPSEENLNRAFEMLSELEGELGDLALVNVLISQISTTYADHLAGLSINDAVTKLRNRNTRFLDASVLDPAVRRVLANLLERFRSSLSDGDYESASDDYDRIIDIDDSLSELLLVDVKKIPSTDFEKLPGDIAAKLLPFGDYSGRFGLLKEQLTTELGGTVQTRQSVIDGLEWLRRNQGRDGGWSMRGPYENGGFTENACAATAMALLALLGDGNTHTSGEFREVVDSGVRFLLSLQDQSGFMAGKARSHQKMYAQAQATLALCELYGMTKDPRLLAPAQGALDFAIRAQSSLGGWRYEPAFDSDTSVTGWYVMALESGRIAGLNVDMSKLEKVNKYLDSASSRDGATYGYQKGTAPSPAMTASGLLSRQYLGWKRDHPPLERGIESLLQDAPFKLSDNDVYYWYHASRAIFSFGGRAWKQWNDDMSMGLPQLQVTGGGEDGSWKPVQDRWGKNNGRLYTTCLSILCLESYYRYLPRHSAEWAEDGRVLPRLSVATNQPLPAVAPFDASEAKKHQEVWARELNLDEVTIENSIGMKLCVIPPGTFSMGSDTGAAKEKPRHKVTLTKPFLLGVYEVTQGQYKQVMGSNPSHSLNIGDLYPVNHLSFGDAVRFCQRLSNLPTEREAGRSYRIPTEAEWEFACRGGTVSTYSFGDDKALASRFAVFSGHGSKPVGSKQPNAFGLYDMHGNEWEWCINVGKYSEKAVTDPNGDSLENREMLRGGCMRGAVGSHRRHQLQKGFSNGDQGFRVLCIVGDP
ncbi:SUMF1/EgtB/PvdO family nonheme iron enzyme [Rubripirellula sp.]|nr:SUMF1/EgtB/PvdO family nonheme iron enzyme [Rubripirellula sp.]MDB4621628.1 SUMF1/EgtB/PvdO family nonheme iron enzyme [Rubripirellula sp.]